ncbi:MAG: nitroreductase family protein [Acidimicrobiia bacterium]
METWEAIRSRRNVREYDDRPITDHEMDRILEAGWRTPSSRNEQRWDFVVSTDRQQLTELAKVWRGAGHVARSQATIALIAPKADNASTRDSIHYDLGQVTMSMMLAAADLGIGSCHSSVVDQELAQRLLGFPDSHYCAWLIGFGYPSDRPLVSIRRPRRKPLAGVVHHGGW